MASERIQRSLNESQDAARTRVGDQVSGRGLRLWKGLTTLQRLQRSNSGINPRTLILPAIIPTARGQGNVGRSSRACSSAVEQGTHNPLVGGSNPSGPTN